MQKKKNKYDIFVKFIKTAHKVVFCLKTFWNRAFQKHEMRENVEKIAKWGAAITKECVSV